jgi:hypothetical protein
LSSTGLDSAGKRTVPFLNSQVFTRNFLRKISPQLWDFYDAALPSQRTAAPAVPRLS